MCDDNHYEEVIDKMMLDLIDPKLHGKINSLEHKYKRLAILSLLDKDRRLFTSIKNIVKDNKVTKVNHVKDVIKMLREYVRVGEVEKKKFGEVMTPLELVKDMIQTIPNDFWKNPNSKILDPANGVGPFPWMVIYRLMIGLKDWEPNEEKRYKHIIENMIHVCELQPKNMFLWMVAVDPEDEYSLNLFNGSFLSPEFDFHMKNVWGVEKFDLILGNPPYQEQKEGNRKTQSLWNFFVEKSFTFLKEKSGYLVMIHPDGWRGLGDGYKKVKQLLKSKEMLYLEVHDKLDGIKLFGAKTSYDFYCIRNNSNDGNFNTKIKFIDGKTEMINISKIEFIPNGMYDSFRKILAEKNEERVNILSGSSYHTQRLDMMSKNQNEEFKYPCVYMIYKNGSINSWYSNTNKKGHFGIPKIIWSNGMSTPIVDKDGKYGLTQFSFAIIDEIENLENIKKAMLNPKFLKLISFSDGSLIGHHNYSHKAISTFRKDFWKEFIND